MVSELGGDCVAYTMIICGEVKHVGFRRFVWGLARRLNLGGYVSNLPDNCVEIYVEGGQEGIEEFKGRILSNRVYNIEKINATRTECKYLSKDFIIIRCAGELGEF